MLGWFLYLKSWERREKNVLDAFKKKKKEYRRIEERGGERRRKELKYK
jgi:hypothetical protein